MGAIILKIFKRKYLGRSTNFIIRFGLVISFGARLE